MQYLISTLHLPFIGKQSKANANAIIVVFTSRTLRPITVDNSMNTLQVRPISFICQILEDDTKQHNDKHMSKLP